MSSSSKIAILQLAVIVPFAVLFCGFSNSLLAQGGLTRSEQAVIAKLPQVPPKLNGDYWMDRRPAQTVKTKLSMSVTTPSLVAETWVFALPENPATPGQEVQSSSTIPESIRILDRSVLERPLRYAKFPADTAELKRNASIQAEAELLLYSRSLRRKSDSNRSSSEPTQVESLAETTRKYFLRPSLECDYTSKVFREWKAKHELQRIETEGEILFAKRTFQELVRSYQYLYVPNQDRTATALCKADKTDCGGLSILFTTIMRSEGVPARVLAGRWAKSANEGEKIDGNRYYQYHVIAEFYADEVGWVPLDLSSAILHDKSPEKLMFFGHDRGNFVVMHIDTGLDFDSGLFGKYRNAFLQIPVFWVRGTGSLKDKTTQEAWEVVTVSANRRR